jgi:hypothetical protein
VAGSRITVSISFWRTIRSRSYRRFVWSYSTRDFSSYFGALLSTSGPTDYDYCICLIYNNSYSKSGTLESAMGMIIATFMLVGIFQIILDLKDRRLYKIFSISCCFWFYDRRRFIIILFQIFPFAGVTSPKLL